MGGRCRFLARRFSSDEDYRIADFCGLPRGTLWQSYCSLRGEGQIFVGALAKNRLKCLFWRVF
jgi:hypothetical protein